MTADIWPFNYGRRELPAALRSKQPKPLPSINLAPSTRLADFESFAHYAQRARTDTLRELREIDLTRSKRTAVYCFGAGEGFLLDRLNPRWKQSYFEHLLSTDELFENLMPNDGRKPEPARP
jgi:hypothetical protein